MLSVAVNRILPGKEDRLRAWLREMEARRDEAAATFREQTVRHAQAFIVRGADGPLFMMVAEVVDPARAREAFRASGAVIDSEFKKIAAECLGEHVDDTPLWDCKADLGPAG